MPKVAFEDEEFHSRHKKTSSEQLLYGEIGDWSNCALLGTSGKAPMVR
jgi:hypothetical protein